MTALLALGAFLAARQGALAQPFPAQGDDTVLSVGQFLIVVNPQFTNLMAGYPNYNASTHVLVSPALIDYTTDIARSGAILAGSFNDYNGVPCGGAGTIIGQSQLVVQPGGLEPDDTR